MYDIEKTKELVKSKLVSDNPLTGEKRFIHSLGVAEAALVLKRKFYNFLDENVVEFTALIHDYCKYEKIDNYKKITTKYNIDEAIFSESEKIYHSVIGCYIIKDVFKINDDNIVNAIKYHTFGSNNMTPLEEIIYVSDYIEKNRVGIESFNLIKKHAKVDIKKAVAMEAKILLDYLMTTGAKIYPSAYDTYEGYKKYLEETK